MAEAKLTNDAKKPTMTERRRVGVLEKLWLTYYNDTLYEKGVITEDERNRMRVRIKNRSDAMER